MDLSTNERVLALRARNERVRERAQSFVALFERARAALTGHAMPKRDEQLQVAQTYAAIDTILAGVRFLGDQLLYEDEEIASLIAEGPQEQDLLRIQQRLWNSGMITQVRADIPDTIWQPAYEPVLDVALEAATLMVERGEKMFQAIAASGG